MSIDHHIVSSCVAILLLISVALISPGPDFAVVVKNSISSSKKYALLTAVGVSLGIFFHLAIITLGFGIFITNHHWLLLIIQYVGACYLIYLGFKALKTQRPSTSINIPVNNMDTNLISALFSGILTSTLNPKTILFFSSIFSLFVSKSIPPSALLICDIAIFFIAILWFGFIAMCLSSNIAKKKFMGFSYWLQRISGCFLIFLSIKLIFTTL